MAATATAPLLVSDEAGMRTLTLNRPDRYNALSLGLMNDLIAELDRTGGDDGVRAVIIRGSGRGFCAGHDLAEMQGCALGEYRELFDVCSRLMMAIHRLPQPVIAQVHGVATAAGCQLVAACDLAIADEGARFGTPGVRIGLFCSTPMVEVSRAVGRKRAMQMLLTGDLIDAPTAVEWGLINAVASDSLEDETLALARRMAESSALTLAIGKRAFYEQLDIPIDAAYDHAREVMARNAATDDAQEGIAAFLEKRAPVWRGR